MKCEKLVKWKLETHGYNNRVPSLKNIWHRGIKTCPYMVVSPYTGNVTANLTDKPPEKPRNHSSNDKPRSLQDIMHWFQMGMANHFPKGNCAIDPYYAAASCIVFDCRKECNSYFLRCACSHPRLIAKALIVLWVWLHLQRARVGVCVWCSCV